MAGMDNKKVKSVEDAFNSMLRSDYIPLKETAKLLKLSEYYVDYLGFLREIVGETDHLIVGRRGTGKTTLLYRGLIECIQSWNSDTGIAKEKTLAIYIDLSKCQSLDDTASKEFAEFEHVFATELYESIKTELIRTWPALEQKQGLLSKIFSSKEAKAKSDTNAALENLSSVLRSGVLRVEQKGGERKETVLTENGASYEQELGLNASAAPEGKATAKRGTSEKETKTVEGTVTQSYRLNISDVLRALGEIRDAAGISHIVILIDEFSSLNGELQRRFSSLLRKILGNHSGVFVKLSAITDNYSLGSSIILQRDLFELNLDLDSFVERSGSLGSALRGLEGLTEKLITERLRSYAPGVTHQALFEDFQSAVREVTRAAMGVPRTVGIVLKQAFLRSVGENRQSMRKADIEYGIKYASKAYVNQFIGACGVGLPAFYLDIWHSLLERAIAERDKAAVSSSHFMLLPKHEAKLKYFNMFFLAHLLTQGRTTKKDKASRSLYCFDYGVCLENNMVWGEDKNVIRQQRFAYDETLDAFENYFRDSQAKKWRCRSCGVVYNEADLQVAGLRLEFCPKDRSDLEPVVQSDGTKYTEEEVKIIGAIRSSSEEDELVARSIADDVGCYVQKVAKFGAKLEREQIIKRKLKDKYIYFIDEA